MCEHRGVGTHVQILGELTPDLWGNEVGGEEEVELRVGREGRHYGIMSA